MLSYINRFKNLFHIPYNELNPIEKRYIMFRFGLYVALMYFRAYFCRWVDTRVISDNPLEDDKIIRKDYTGDLSSWSTFDFFFNNDDL